MKDVMDRTLLNRRQAPSVSEADRRAIADYLKRYGARRFESGFSADVHGCQDFLARRGYELKVRNSFRLYSLRKIGAAGRPKLMKFNSVIAFIDQIRVAEGLAPISRRAA